jgi:hypothetical protein
MNDFSHRQRLTAVPAGGFIEVLKDSGTAVPEYMPLSLLTAVPVGGLQPVYLNAANQSLSGAGAVNVTSPTTLFTSTGVDDALTLADGTVAGQMKCVSHVVDGGSGVLTPANFEDGTDITFTNAGESWTGIWTGSTWRTVGLSGAVIA